MKQIPAPEIFSLLTQWALRPDATADLRNIFGGDSDRYQPLLQFIRSGDFSWVPEVQILSASSMGSADGAYSRKTRSIYISADCPLDQIEAVLLEEIGHHIDALFNEQETPGDEGTLFSAAVRGIPLSDEEITAILNEDDSAILTLNGHQVAVECARRPAPASRAPSKPVVTAKPKPKAPAPVPVNNTLEAAVPTDLSDHPTKTTLILTGSDDIVGRGNSKPTNYLQANDGDSTLIAGTSALTLTTLKGGGGNATLIGGSGKATLIGGNQNNLLQAGTGAQLLIGGASAFSSNTLLGGDGFNTLKAGKGYSTLDSRSRAGGKSLLIADGASSSLVAGLGNDSLTAVGFGGDTTMIGGTGKVLMVGGKDSNSLVSGSRSINQSNTLLAGTGENTLVAGLGRDLLKGGDGKNVLLFNQNNIRDQNILLSTKSASTNILGLNSSSPINIQDSDLAKIRNSNRRSTLDAITNFGSGGASITLGINAQALKIESIIGGNGGDTLTIGTSYKSALDFYGGTGNDLIVADSREQIVNSFKNGGSLYGGSGIDTLRIVNSATLNDDAFFSTNNVEKVDVLDLVGSANLVTLGGSASADGYSTVYGGNGGNTLIQDSSFSDGLTLIGGDGKDLFGLTSDSYLTSISVAGGASTDTLQIGSANSTSSVFLSDSLFGNVNGIEVLSLSGSGTSRITLGSAAQASGISTIYGSSGGNSVTQLASDTLSLNLVGGIGNDSFNIANSTLLAGNTISGGSGSGVDALALGSAATLNDTVAFKNITGIEVLSLSGTSLAGSSVTLSQSVSGGIGISTVLSGAGNDHVSMDTFFTDYLSGGLGIDTLEICKGTTLGSAFSKLSGVEVLSLSDNTVGYSIDLTSPNQDFSVSTIVSGAGNDYFGLYSPLAGSLIAGGGTDTLYLSRASTLDNSSFAKITGIEVLSLTGTSLAGSSVTLGSLPGARDISSIFGGDGNDTFTRTSENNRVLTLHGGKGDDLFTIAITPTLGNDSIVGDLGTDTLQIGYTGSFNTGNLIGNLSGVEVLSLTGSNQSDTLKGDTLSVILGASDSLSGLRSIITGRGGSTLDAGAYGNAVTFDTSANTASASSLVGSSLGDEFVFSSYNNSAAQSTISGGGGNDTLSFRSQSTIQDLGFGNNKTSIEAIALSSGGNLVGTLQGSGVTRIYGNRSSDSVLAKSRGDTLTANVVGEMASNLGGGTTATPSGSQTITLTLPNGATVRDATSTLGFKEGMLIAGNGIRPGTSIVGAPSTINGKLTLILSSPTTAAIATGSQITGWLDDVTLDGGNMLASDLETTISFENRYAIQKGQFAIGVDASSLGVINVANELKVGDRISGTGIAPGTTIASISSNDITLSNPVTQNIPVGSRFLVPRFITENKKGDYLVAGGQGNLLIGSSPTAGQLIDNTLVSAAYSNNTLLGGGGANRYIINNIPGDTLIPVIRNTTTLDAKSSSLQSASTIQFTGDSIILTDTSLINVGKRSAQVILTADGNNKIEIGDNATDIGIQTIIGGKGSDTFTTGITYNPSVYFDASRGSGIQSLAAGKGSDTLLAGTGNATLEGGDGNNSLVGGLGNNSIHSGVGNSTLDGGFGISTLQAEGGNNFFVVRSRETRILAPETSSTPLTATVNSYVNFDPIQGITSLTLAQKATPGEKSITVTKVTGINVGDTIQGAGIPENTTVNIVDATKKIIFLTKSITLELNVDSSLWVDQTGPFQFAPTQPDGSPSITKSPSFASSDLSNFYNLKNFNLLGTAKYGVGNALNNNITSESPDALLLGMGGNNTLVASGANSSLYGNITSTYSNPDLYATAPLDTKTREFVDGVIGVAGNNSLVANGANSFLDGGEGYNDRLFGSGANTLIGNGGNSTLVQRHQSDKLISGGAGTVFTSVDLYRMPDNVSDVVVVVTPQGTNSGQVTLDGQRMTAGYVAVNGATGGYTKTHSVKFGGAPLITVDKSIQMQVLYGASEGAVYEISAKTLTNTTTLDITWEAKPIGVNDTSPLIQTLGYVITYRKKDNASLPWLTYLNGTSQDLKGTTDNPRLTVTGLDANTEYEFKVTAQETVLPAYTDKDGKLIAKPVSLIGGSGSEVIYGDILDSVGKSYSNTRAVLNNNPVNPADPIITIETPAPFSPNDTFYGLFPTYQDGKDGNDLLIAPVIGIDNRPSGGTDDRGSGRNFTTYQFINNVKSKNEIIFSGLNTLVGGTGSDTFVVYNGGITLDTLNGVVTTGAYDQVIKYGLETPAGENNLVISRIKYLTLSDTDVSQGKFINQAWAAGANQYVAGNRLDNSLIGYGLNNTLIGSLGRDSIVADNSGILDSGTNTLIGGTAYGLDSIAGAMKDYYNVVPENNGTTGFTARSPLQQKDSIYRDTDPVPPGVNGPGTADNSQYWMVNGPFGPVFDPLRNSDTLVANNTSTLVSAVIDGGAGNDSMVGGKGNDTLYVSNGLSTNTNVILASDIVVGGGGDGNDWIIFTGSDTYWSGREDATKNPLGYALSKYGDAANGQSISNIKLQDGSPVARRATGNATSTGNQHDPDNAILGGFGEEEGSNHLIGNEFDNTLDGGGVGGIVGKGEGVDTLTGGGGADLFIIGANYINAVVSRSSLRDINREISLNDLRGRNWATDADYAEISDFTGDDKLELSGNISDYVIGSAPSGFYQNNINGADNPLRNNTTKFGIYKVNGESYPDLVAVINCTDGFNLGALPADFHQVNGANVTGDSKGLGGVSQLFSAAEQNYAGVGAMYDIEDTTFKGFVTFG